MGWPWPHPGDEALSMSSSLLAPSCLERLTKLLFDETPTDESTAKMKKRFMNVEPSLVTNGQSAKAIEPCECALHHPSVTPQLLAALHATPGDTRCDAPLAKSRSIGLGVISFVSMHLVRTLAGSTSSTLEGRDGIYHLHQRRCVRNVRTSTLQDEGYSFSLDHKMALRAWFAFIRRILACSFLPFFTPLALTVCESKEALDQSISPAWLRVSSSSLCSFFQTPAFSQSRSLRQQVIPEPQPISCGSISHCNPLLSTNTMPVSAARFGIRGRPPFGLGGSAGKSGSITSHNSSDINAFAIPNFTKFARFC